MVGRQRMAKFHRATPIVRREALVEATLRSLEEFGHDGTSIRRISAAAGVSIGLINHHFRSKAELIAAAYETLAVSLQESMRAQSGNEADLPRTRLSGFFRASFAPDILEPGIFSVWLVFWSMVMHSPEMRAVHDRTYRQYRAILEGLLQALAASGEAPPFKLRLAAIALSALLDGLWVELSLSPTTFKAAEAITVCEDWVSALCGGALPGLLLLRDAPARRRGRAGRGRPAHDRPTPQPGKA
jgi:AcrR family transcriptional regulator